MNSQDLILDRIAQRIAERKGVLLINDVKYSNVGTLRTIDENTLAHLGSVTYDFQDYAVHFGPVTDRVAAHWYDDRSGSAPWVKRSIAELIDAVVNHLLRKGEQPDA